jgi:hypothetical protein
MVTDLRSELTDQIFLWETEALEARQLAETEVDERLAAYLQGQADGIEAMIDDLRQTVLHDIAFAGLTRQPTSRAGDPSN